MTSGTTCPEDMPGREMSEARIAAAMRMGYSGTDEELL
jgi:hypothetical protein